MAAALSRLRNFICLLPVDNETTQKEKKEAEEYYKTFWQNPSGGGPAWHVLSQVCAKFFAHKTSPYITMSVNLFFMSFVFTSDAELFF